jgi:hypothetical protein
MNAISPPVQSLLDLFSTDLADLRFADVDASTLAVLTASVESAAETVGAAQAALDAARTELQGRQDLLQQHAQRALAYARVYAEGDAELSARLDAIALPRAARRGRTDGEEPLVLSAAEAAPRKRGRPRKEAAAPESTPALEAVLEPVTSAAE